MIPHHIYYQLVIVGLLWLCVMLHYVWPSQDAVSPPPPVPPQLKRKRSKEGSGHFRAHAEHGMRHEDSMCCPQAEIPAFGAR
jgi:hypothetical protein